MNPVARSPWVCVISEVSDLEQPVPVSEQEGMSIFVFDLERVFKIEQAQLNDGTVRDRPDGTIPCHSIPGDGKGNLRRQDSEVWKWISPDCGNGNHARFPAITGLANPFQ